MAGGELPRRDTIGEAVADTAARQPDALALRDGARELTYAELDREANRLAHAIAAADPGRARPNVGVLVPQGVTAVVAILAGCRASRTVVPLDVDDPPDRIAELVGQVGPMVAVGAPGVRAAVPDAVWVDPADLDPRLPTDMPAIRIGRDDPLVVLFTSGSTGRPKGSLRSHGAQLFGARRWSEDYGIGPGHRSGLVFDHTSAAASGVIFPTLVLGGSVHIRDVRTFGAVGLAAWLDDEEITGLTASAALIDVMLETEPPDRPLEHLRRVIFVADTLRSSTVRRMAPYLSADAELVNNYGSSESGIVAEHRLRAGDVAALTGDVVPPGQVHPSVRVDLREANDRGIGEIVVATPFLALGYVDDATDDRGAYRTDDEGVRWFHTGDLGRLGEDGVLEYHGRLDDRLKVRAHTIDPSEVEAAALRVPGVREVHVAGYPSPRGTRLAAYVAPDPGTALSTTSVRRGLRPLLPGWMIPQRVVVVERLPRLPRGKVDRSALVPPGPERPELEQPYEAPATLLERVVVAAFEQVLGVDGVGRLDEFFDLGGDSLAAVEVTVQLAADLHREVDLAMFLDTPTPAAIAERLQGAEHLGTGRVVALQPTGPGAPIFCVHGGGGPVLNLVGLAPSTEGQRPFYGVQMQEHDRARDLFDLPALARRYADEVSATTTGTCVIAGHSFGAVAAHALTAELRRRDAPVAGLLLIDPLVPGRGWPGGWRSQLFTLHALTGRAPRAHRLHRERMAAGVHGVRRYRGEPVDVPIVLFRAEAGDGDPSAWKPLAGAGLEVVDVPGDHESLIEPPHVDVLGKAIAEAAARLTAGGVTGGA